jgi:hypothetical protein
MKKKGMSNRINLESMHDRHRALTVALSGAYQEAVSVCLSRHHKSPVLITVSDGGTESEAEVVWSAPDSKTLGAWANTTDATEAGAYGFVIAGLEYLRGLFAVRRAETGTGADYYVGPHGSGEEDLEACLRLEVSGVDGGNREAVATRLGAKIRQAQRGASNLPALAGVIGFSAKLLMVRDVPEEM